MKKALHTWGILFLLTTMICIPFQFDFIKIIGKIQYFVLFPIVDFIAKMLDLPLILKDLSSDTTGLYTLFILLLSMTLPVSFWISKRENLRITFAQLFQTVAPYYLALILLKYGLDKVLMVQFPTPGPNLLYTPLGYQDKDILFWSVMGLSKGYMIFTGVAEIIPALLLIFRKTRTFGAVLSTIVFTHVLALNLSFDISVKLYSAILLLISLMLAAPFFNWLIKSYRSGLPAPFELRKPLRFRIKLYVKILVIAIMVVEAFIPYISNGSSNHAIPNLAFDMIDVHNEKRIGKLYIHEDGFLIIQDLNYESLVYPIHSNSIEQGHLIIEKVNQLKTLSLRKTKRNTFEITHPEINEYITCKALEVDQLPALDDKFHWTVDELVVQ